MDLVQLIEKRASDARAIIEKCIGDSGIWASSELEDSNLPGYRGLLWTRDFAIGGIDGLLAVGREDVIQKHLEEIARQQESDGRIPTLFADSSFDWKADKLRLAKEDPKRIPGYAWKWMNKKLGRFSLQRYTPKSTDPTLQYVNALITYAEHKGSDEILQKYKENIEKALSFIESQKREGLYRGLDWRDNLGVSAKIALLSNNSLLYSIYDRLGHGEKAAHLSSRIRESFWRGTYHTDQEYKDFFDAFGEALAVLYDVADRDRYGDIASKFRRMFEESDFGFRANDRDLSSQSWRIKRKNARVNQYGTIWPWATGHIILALDKMGETDLARKAFNVWTEKLEGFREWYNPNTGEGRGAVNFMASAALYLRAGQELGLIQRK